MEPQNVAILGNRAQTNINLGYFHRALEDADKLLELVPSHSKGIYSKSKALAGLKRYDDAIKVLSENYAENEHTKEFEELLESLKSLKVQTTTGEFDVFKLYQSVQKFHEDVADFVGPVEVKCIPGEATFVI